MYPNLKAEMARRQVTANQLAQLLEVRPATVSDKMNGRYRFYYEEVLAIKRHFFPDLSIEYLFHREEDVKYALRRTSG